MLHVVDHLLVALIVVGLALRAWFGIRALRRQPPGDVAAFRRRTWARAIVTQWLLVAAVIAWWFVQHRPFSRLYVVPHLGWGFGGVMLGIATMSVALRAQQRAIATSADVRAKLRRRLGGVAAILPATRADWPGFASLAITAGVCEELLFRGFVTWWLLGVIPVFWVAIVAQGVLFGLAHAYQGPRGVLTTGAVGLFMGALVWVTGSLWAAMVLHALMDLHAGHTVLAVYEADAAAASAPA